MPDPCPPPAGASASSFRLLLESPSNDAATPVEVPPGISAWVWCAESLDPVRSPGPATPALFFEPLMREKPPRLLLIDQGDFGIQVNDQKVPGVCLMRVGDQVRIAGGPPMEVALFHRIRVGPPQPEHVGQLCPVCLTAVQSQSRVYQCPACGLAMHLEESGADPLICAQVVPCCPRCTMSIRPADAYHTPPDFLEP